ncbi:Cdc6/Cdc18 family protein [Haloarchaeobius sp. HRN-SO-5]|uniref:Cdc6/Cdc18 family protein n=1 Tax=Haloarchaeobius sp. HRN-SO-5 TaxID=3446118 RepID=UPI003EBE3D1D
MITDPRVLRDEWVPSEVRHRNAELNQLSTALRPVADDDRPGSAFLHGPPGAGKTCCAQYIVSQFCREVRDVAHQYVNCWTDSTRFAVLERLLENVDADAAVHRQSTPVDELVRQLRDHGEPYVAILDEVDVLRDTDVLYDLYQVPDVAVVLVANQEEEFLADLDPRLQSRLRTCTSIRMTPYTTDQLVSILEDRVRLGFEPGTVETAQLERIADAAAGDARLAINVLRMAARNAQDAGADALDPAHVTAAIPEGEHDVRRKTLSQLSRHQRVLYEVVHEAGEVDSAMLHERYEARVDEPMVRRTRRKHLNKLCEYDLLEKAGEGRGRTYRVVEPAPVP